MDRSLAPLGGGRREGRLTVARLKEKKLVPLVFEYGSNLEKESWQNRWKRDSLYWGIFCFFKNNFFDNDLELKSNLEKDGEDGILRYFDINRREKVFAWIFSFCFFYVIATYRIAKYRE